MLAKETALKSMFEGKRQFAIPLYQRRYAWKDKDWQSFWVAVTRQYDLLAEGGDALKKPTHFLGSLVVQPTSDQSSGLSTYAVIDGQQRLTTAVILFIVIHDLWESDEDRERIHETYLVNKWETGNNRYKLLPGMHDRLDFQALVRGEADNAVGVIGEAYRWFKNEVQVFSSNKEGVDFDILERTILGRLEVVDVTLTASDNAHRIFQTLNSTGRSLSQVDLLRNHFFMLLPTKAEDAYAYYWQPMEDLLGTRMDLYLWAETVSRGGGREGVPRDQVYVQWQQDLSEFEDDEDRVFATVQELHRRAKFYAKILEPQTETANAVQNRLRRLKEWGSNVYHPLALQAILELADHPNDLARALLYLESFMVRRMLAHIPTNNLNRICTTTAGQLVGSTTYADDLRKKLSGRGKYWPTDAEIRASVLTEPFYQAQRATQRQFVLRRLEEFLPGQELPDWHSATYTIEHVMPQHATDEWLAVLRAESPGEEALTSHAALVDTIGNLTLTTENSSLSDHPLQRKQEILGSSILKMNKEIQESASWDRSTIETRSTTLGEAVIEIWPGPVEDTSQAEVEAWHADVRSTLAFIPDSSWISMDDLAEHVERSALEVHNFLVLSAPAGKEHVLKSDGRIDTSFPWIRKDVAGYRGLLVARGILDGNRDEVASSSQRLMLEELVTLQTGAV